MISEVNLCACGCGKPTPIAPSTRPSRGWVKGSHVEYYPHHSKNRYSLTTNGGKQCRDCKAVKPLSDFSKDTRSRDGLQAKCRECCKHRSASYRSTQHGKVRYIVARTKHRMKTYKFTQEQFDAMAAKQDWRCAICRQPETETYKGIPKSLAIDHCHRTGVVRGLLCCACNHAIGKFRDDPELLRRAADYVSR